MKLRDRWRNWKRKRATRKATRGLSNVRPLREFVYLDEISLRSLLVSQRNTIPEQESRSISQAEEAEATAKVSGGNDLVGKGEVGSRFKTSNSNSLQTSRKAIVQSLFNELREAENVSYVVMVDSANSLNSLASEADITTSTSPTVAAPAAELKRGALIEVEVILEVDSVFKLSTLFAEYKEMADESGDMFDADSQTYLRELAPVNRLLQRLLAGLIPIRARAVAMCIVEIEGRDYVVHEAAIKNLSIKRRPLYVVGVTEHLSYWKDIRRVLFSGSKFTILGRISRDGLHESWTPVKLADLFRESVPDLVEQINEASRTGVEGLMSSNTESENDEKLSTALSFYQLKLEELAGVHLGDIQNAELMAATRTIDGSSVSGQRHAFSLVRKAIEQEAGDQIVDASTDLLIRQEARAASGLELMATSGSPVATVAPAAQAKADDRLMDVEVVAIYW